MAHISVSAEKVLAAAKEVIAHCEMTRLMRDENKLRKVMAVPRKPWYNPWAHPHYMTREQAIAHLDKVAENMWVDSWHSYYGTSYQVAAERLMLMAQHGDPVVLDEESTQILFGNWRKES